MFGINDIPSGKGRPKFNFRKHGKPEYEVYLQNREFIEYLGDRVGRSTQDIEQGIKTLLNRKDNDHYATHEMLNDLYCEMNDATYESRQTNVLLSELIRILKGENIDNKSTKVKKNTSEFDKWRGIK